MVFFCMDEVNLVYLGWIEGLGNICGWVWGLMDYINFFFLEFVDYCMDMGILSVNVGFYWIYILF